MTIAEVEPAADPPSRTATPGSPGPLTDAVIRIGVSVVVGWLATLVGAVMIGVGYLRVDSGDTLAEQFAYFSSACVGGLALIGLGGLAVLSRQHADAARAVKEIRCRVGSARPANASPANVGAGAASGAVAVAVVNGSSTYHRSDCVFVAGRPGVRAISPRSPEARAMRPCQVCDPAGP